MRIFHTPSSLRRHHHHGHPPSAPSLFPPSHTFEIAYWTGRGVFSSGRIIFSLRVYIFKWFCSKHIDLHRSVAVMHRRAAMTLLRGSGTYRGWPFGEVARLSTWPSQAQCRATVFPKCSFLFLSILTGFNFDNSGNSGQNNQIWREGHDVNCCTHPGWSEECREHISVYSSGSLHNTKNLKTSD